MKPEIYIITGTSGSGKTSFARILEDNGFYCVDNIPVPLIPKFLELILNSSEPIQRVAFVLDIRERRFPQDFLPLFRELKEKDFLLKLFFLDANDPALIRRFKETRRKHPLDAPTLEEAIKREREILTPVREMADYIIDTSELTPAKLRERVVDILKESTISFSLQLFSFGYKYGIPQDADIVFDARVLPNPYFVPELKEKSGLDEKVKNFLMDKSETKEVLSGIENFLEMIIPYYKKEGRRVITIGVGCTGGRHRSVFMTERLAEIFRKKGYNVFVLHRDIEKG
jgi:UPF0042 nucleotide-binding protein